MKYVMIRIETNHDKTLQTNEAISLNHRISFNQPKRYFYVRVNRSNEYDRWFKTPIGRLVRKYESSLLLEFLDPRPGERILDVGCGTGIFTQDVLDCGAIVTGIDLSVPMLKKAITRVGNTRFTGLCADMYILPYFSNSFDKVFSMTAIEFVPDAEGRLPNLIVLLGKKAELL